MRAMAFLRLCVFAALNFATESLQQSKNPLNDFCRRWGHQTAQVDGKLYIDGGLVAWNPLSANPLNYTNTWLLYGDLNSTTQDVGMPMQHANLTKNSTVPSVSGGILWSDEINKCFYLYGGEYQSNPTDFSFWAYDTILNQWNETEYQSNVNSIQRVSFGAGTQIDELGLGFYYGGWMSNATSPEWKGNPMASSNLIVYDFSDGTLNNNSGPDTTGRAEGSMVYLPASDGGLLVYFGGVEDPNQNGSFVGANMSTIHIFDVASSKWYTQEAGGSVPALRRQFCAGATWADDYSSYNIYLYGGFGTDPQNITGFDDAYILSLPSFTWIKVFPTDNSTTPYGHGGCSANVINRDQMIIIGGWFPSTTDCDSVNGWGQHNMNLGYNGPQNALWDKYNPTVDTYFVPTPVISVIGGGPTGGATATKPATWNNPDLPVYFDRVASFSARAATRTIPTGTSSPTGSGGGSKTNVGAIAGGVVGGLVFLIAVLCLILFCLHRKKKAKKAAGGEKQENTSPPPAELAATAPIHEMASPGASKYISMQQPDPATHPIHSVHSRSPSDQPSQTSPFLPQTYQATTPSSIAAAYPSPYTTHFPQDHHQQYSQQYSDNPSAYDAHAYPASPPHHQQHHYYPTPTSPNQPPFPLQQQQYYPPPADPSARSHPSYSERMTSPEGTQYSGDTAHNSHIPPSTTNTPAQFYAQPVPQRPYAGGSERGEGGSLRGIGEDGDGLSGRGSVDSRRRPIKSRFVEEDHL